MIMKCAKQRTVNTVAYTIRIKWILHLYVVSAIHLDNYYVPEV